MKKILIILMITTSLNANTINRMEYLFNKCSVHYETKSNKGWLRVLNDKRCNSYFNCLTIHERDELRILITNKLKENNYKREIK